MANCKWTNGLLSVYVDDFNVFCSDYFNLLESKEDYTQFSEEIIQGFGGKRFLFLSEKRRRSGFEKWMKDFVN